MNPFVRLDGRAAPLDIANVDTDQIIPKQFLKTVEREGLGKGLFFDFRFDQQGRRIDDFVLNRPEYKGVSVLIAGDNFGCGSSREHAVWAMRAWGVRCVVGASPAEFFRDNCLKNGVLPVTLAPEAMAALLDLATRIDGREPFTADLERCEIRGPAGYVQAFAITPGEREALLEGLDDIGLTLRQLDAIQAWEQRTAKVRPFMQQRMPGAGRHPL
jgi:3-isopropylmalate dehydratase small subunit